jgi:outer membrane immunogenic protein
MKKFLIIGAAAASLFAASPSFAEGVNADVHVGISGGKPVGQKADLLYGVGVGYDFDLGSKFFAGPQVGFDEESDLAFGIINVNNKAAVLRLGYNIDQKAKVYLLGGYTNFLSNDGIRAGIGFEHAIGSKYFVKAEFRHNRFRVPGWQTNQGLIGVGAHF